ncbi:MAG TPA: glucokinase [Stellaceae bacterium]|nr:glucokinase [Stellaceae bacterium]
MTGRVRLLGDIGATNARFAIYGEDRRASRARIMPVDSFPTLPEAILSYLAAEQMEPPLGAAALAVASPVVGDVITMTNHPWSFSISALQRDLQIERLTVINDFSALALAVRHLNADERVAIGRGEAVPSAPIAVLGPGTGLGVSGLVPAQGGWVALAGEGGHATMAATDDRESEVLSRLRRRFTHVSAERVLSGQGLVNLYHALADIEGVPAEPYTPAQIADHEIGEREPMCRAAVAMFCAMLGAVAGDLALTLGARGGVYIAGGIVPRFGARFAETSFRERFENKGRFRSYLAAIPTYVVTAAVPAFLGLAELMERGEQQRG